MKAFWRYRRDPHRTNRRRLAMSAKVAIVSGILLRSDFKTNHPLPADTRVNFLLRALLTLVARHIVVSSSETAHAGHPILRCGAAAAAEILASWVANDCILTAASASAVICSGVYFARSSLICCPKLIGKDDTSAAWHRHELAMVVSFVSRTL